MHGGLDEGGDGTPEEYDTVATVQPLASSLLRHWHGHWSKAGANGQRADIADEPSAWRVPPPEDARVFAREPYELLRVELEYPCPVPFA